MGESLGLKCHHHNGWLWALAGTRGLAGLTTHLKHIDAWKEEIKPSPNKAPEMESPLS